MTIDRDFPASLYVQPHIGGDVALLTGVAKVLLERNAVDGAFIAAATEGFEAYQKMVRAASRGEIERGGGVGRAQVEQEGRAGLQPLPVVR